MKFIRLFIISLFIFQTTYGQTWQDTLALIDKSFTQYQSENPGCQLSVSRNGNLIFSKAWGMADLERNVPLSTNSILEAGSVSKQFTAASILLLEQQGKLSLDDDVRKYIPELPYYGTPIRLRQMLHHTSGLREWEDLVKLTGWPRTKKFYANADVLEIIARQKHLNNKPGEEFLYSNSNYILLTVIAERVSGLSLQAFTKKYIFEPAGMIHTQWRDDPNHIVPHRAIAYSKSTNGYVTNMPNEYVYGPGGLLTTAEDLLKWNNFYQGGRFGRPSLLSKQIQVDPLNNGSANNYAAGLYIKSVMGWDNISHDGQTASYTAYLESFPELHLSIAVLSNTSAFDIQNVESSVRKIFVSDKTEKPGKNDSIITLSRANVKSLTGMYMLEENHYTYQLTVKDSTLMFQNYVPLLPASEHIFKSDYLVLDFKGTKGVSIFFSNYTFHFTKVKPVNVSNKDLALYVGKYFSEEINASMTIQPESDKLMIRMTASKSYELIPTYADAVKVKELACDVVFMRNPKNKIVGIKFYSWGARGVEFKKIN
ncbi:MAG: serine hydrolase domain-containing protein [Chitinophagaceae bacterium]